MAKKTTSESQSQKRAKQLYTNPKFKADVAEARRGLGIPDNGFKDWMATRPYLKELNEEIMTLMREAGFPRSQLKFTRSGKKYYTHLRERHTFTPVTSLDMAAKDLRQKHGLSRNWDGALQNHLLTGEEWIGSSVVPGVEISYDDASRVRVYVDEFARETDLRHAWRSIRGLFTNSESPQLRRLREAENLPRDSFIYELQASGMKRQDIVLEIEKTDFPNISYQDVPTIVRRFKERGKR